MEWTRAKHFVILLLLLLNVGLAFLLTERTEEKTLLPEQVSAIYTVLSDNGITPPASIPMRFPPMTRLTLTPVTHSREELRRLFFGNEEASLTVEFDRTIFKSATKVLTLQEDTIHLEFLDTEKKQAPLTKESASLAAEQFLRTVYGAGNQMKLGLSEEVDDTIRLTYFPTYAESYIFPNASSFWFVQGSLKQVTLRLYTSAGDVGEKKDIYSADEALLTFFREQQNVNGSHPVIKSVLLGYDFQEKADRSLRLVPCYRIYLEGEEEPYKINAYTNKPIPD